MPIQEGDIRLLKASVQDDVPEGGGRATGVAVVDGQSNNLFPDVSELDRTYGRISLRKVFAGVDTSTVDTYYGAHVIVAEPPSDPRVSVTLFTTASWSDERVAAANKLESYLALGAETRWSLYGNHLAGQRSVQVLAERSVASPAVGDVLGLVRRDAPYDQQFVRIVRIISRAVDQVLADQYGEYRRDILVMEISDPLRTPFPGGTAARYTADWYSPPTRVHATFAADATAYYGVAPLALAANTGDMVLRAGSIYSQLVPSARSEAPIIDARALGDQVLIVPIDGAPPLTFTSTAIANPGAAVQRFFGRAIARGSLAISVAGVTLTDDSNGAIVPTAGFSGTVEYATGAVSFARATGVNAVASFAAAQASAVATAGHSQSTPITIGNRGYTYVTNLSPAPAPGSVRVDYMALGRWYSLVDNGAGGLTGDDGVGTGMVDYATGSLAATLGALPDANTEVLYSWGAPAHYLSHVGTTVFAAPAVRIQIAGGALSPGQITLTYTAGGAAQVCTDTGAGAITGQGSGWVDYANGRIVLRPSLLPDAGTDVVTQYRQGLVVTETHPAGGASTQFTLGHAVLPGSVTLVFSDALGGQYTVRDDGAGAFVLADASLRNTSAGGGQNNSSFASATSYAVANPAGIGGSINYATGACALGAQVSVQVSEQRRQYTDYGGQWSSEWETGTVVTVASGNVQVSYRRATDTNGAPQSQSDPVPAVELDLLPTVANSLVPGSLRLTLGGAVYVDRAGSLVRDPSPATNSGLVAGTVNYAAGKAVIADFPGGASPSVSVACLTRRGYWREWQYRFRVAGAPLQPASLVLRANRAADSVQISVSSDAAGVLSAAQAAGSVDFEFGIVSLSFGSMVADATLTQQEKAEWWYHPSRVVGGQIFRPLLTLPDTAVYNAVAVSNLPLSAAVLGIDPVRLPVDGRVPVLRKGDVLVIHHTARRAPETVTNGQTITLGRVRIARVLVVGANGVSIPDGYTTDLDAGTITFTAVGGYSQPVTIAHRIEDMALCSDAQINGELTITRPLTHDFPLGSYVSSALLCGDLHARVSHLFDQVTWTSTWADVRIGTAASASYNAVQYPVVVTNDGAVQERWLILFTNTNTVNVIGETIGEIVTAHAITNLLAPINPATGSPYFSISAAGWGAGWSAGNCVRINTVAANFPIWVARTVLQGPPASAGDQFILGVRGDVDTP